MNSETPSVFEMVLWEEFGKSATARGTMVGVFVKVFVLQNGHAHQMGTATVIEASASSGTEAVRRLHNYDLPFEHGMDLVVVCPVVMANYVKDLAYPYTFHTKEEATAILGDMFSSRLYAWDIQAVLPVSI